MRRAGCTGNAELPGFRRTITGVWRYNAGMPLPPIQFDREIPLFPLPNCVLFPGVVQPLHIFEPRYRSMMADTLQDQSAIAMVLLKPGWEKNYYSSPAIYEMACVGRIVAHEALPDGKYNLLLQGVTRARVIADRPRAGDAGVEAGVYRVALLEAQADVRGNETAACQVQRRVIKELFEKTALKDLTVTPALAELFEEDLAGASLENADGMTGLPTSRLIDVLAFSLVQDVAVKQRLLEERDPAVRGELLLRELVALAARLGAGVRAGGRAADGSWPPTLGVN